MGPIGRAEASMQQRRADKTPDHPPDRPAEKPPGKPGKPPVKDSVKPKVGKLDEAAELQPVQLGRASDEDLMRRTQTGDKQAFELLYERYSSSVLSYLYRMLGNLEDVESIGSKVRTMLGDLRRRIDLPGEELVRADGEL